MVKRVCKSGVFLVILLVFTISVFGVSNTHSTVDTQQQLIKLTYIDEGEFIKSIATNGEDIVMLAAANIGSMLVYNEEGDFQYMLQIPGGGSIQQMIFINENTVRVIFGKGERQYLINLNDFSLEFVDSGKIVEREHYNNSSDKVYTSNGNRFVLDWAFPIQTKVTMYYGNGNSEIIFKQNQKNTIILSGIFLLMLATHKHIKKKREEEIRKKLNLQ